MKITGLRKKELDISYYTKASFRSFVGKLGASFSFVIILMPIFGLIITFGNIFRIYLPGGSDNVLSKLFTSVGQILFLNIGVWFALAISIGFSKNKGAAVYVTLLSYIIFIVIINSFLKFNDNNKNTFSILFWKALNQKIYLTDLFGYKTFNTGVIGGILIGSLNVIFFNFTKNVSLPKSLSFFEKEKFALLIMPLYSFVFSLIFIMIWPILGFLLSWLGSQVAKSPNGLDSFVFRTIQRMLIPFGSSLLWQAPMWYTQIGGDLSQYQSQLLAEYLSRTNGISREIYDQIYNLGSLDIDSISDILRANNIEYLLNNIEEWIYQTSSVEKLWEISGDQRISIAILNSKYVSIDDCWNIGFRVTRFLTGGFVNSMFVLPTLALFLFLKNSNRKEYGYYISAALTSFLLGITEPVEYMFCFIMPGYFFLVYAPLTGLMGMTTSLLQVKVGTTFSTGLFDFVMNGVIPTINGQKTGIYWIPLVGIIYSLIGYFSFYLWFKFFDINIEKTKKISSWEIKKQCLELIEYFEGAKNILSIEINNDILKVKLRSLSNFKGYHKWFKNFRIENGFLYFEINEERKKLMKTFVESFQVTNKLIMHR